MQPTSKHSIHPRWQLFSPHFLSFSMFISKTCTIHITEDIIGGCVSLGTAHHAGEWANEPCRSTNSFICEEARGGVSTSVSSTQASTVAAVCPSGWIDSGDGMCYQVTKHHCQNSFVLLLTVDQHAVNMNIG